MRHDPTTHDFLRERTEMLEKEKPWIKISRVPHLLSRALHVARDPLVASLNWRPCLSAVCTGPGGCFDGSHETGEGTRTCTAGGTWDRALWNLVAERNVRP